MEFIFANRIGLTALLLLVSLSACNNDPVGTVTPSSDGGSRIEMAPPQKIALSRMINANALFIDVKVDGVDVPMELITDGEPGSEGLRAGSIQLTEGTVQTVVVTWSENFEGALLPLAIAEKPIAVEGDASGNQEFSFVNNDFNYSSDDDGDEISNLQERNEETDPRDINDPPTPPEQVRVTVRTQLPDERILQNEALLSTITPIATINEGTINEVELPLIREGNSWVGRAQVTENSTPFASVTFFPMPGSTLVLANAGFSQDLSAGSDFNFASSIFESEVYDADKDSLSNLDELLGGFNPLDSNSPVQDPCDNGNFTQGCIFDTDGDNKPDSVETEAADTDQDGQPDYLESSLQDNDGDGSNAELDADEENPCVPSATSAPCVASQTDTDLDGKSDVEETLTADTDGDGIPDYRESAILDEDNDGVFDEADLDNTDPCIPSATSAACVATQTDSDSDGKSDVEETLTADTDGDGILDYLDSAILDTDNDGVFDEVDVDNTDPCIPSATSAACVATQTDTDLDGKSDVEETLTADTDEDGIPDYLDSAILDTDIDGVFDELDEDNIDPCVPSERNPTCASLQTDTDMDGETDAEETLTADGDLDGIPDYLESDILDEDSDTLSDEADIANDDPCLPSEVNDACGIVQRDSDDDGKTDLEETLDADTDEDGLPDYLESATADLDSDGIVDELDEVNGDPCLPSPNNPVCEASTTDSDSDGTPNTLP